jgi:hypothetical protein
MAVVCPVRVLPDWRDRDTQNARFGAKMNPEGPKMPHQSALSP